MSSQSKGSLGNFFEDFEVGRVYDEVHDRVPVVSLVERFGEERALHDTAACVTEAVTAHLATLT